ncbi:hypothetical protein ACHAWF_000674 [Thalassiosira exigua]
MEAEYVALITTCCDLFPIMDLVREIGKHFGQPVQDKLCFHVRVHKDNVDTLLIGQLEPRRITPPPKHSRSNITGVVPNLSLAAWCSPKLS